jgi:hypothetical protein
LLDLLHPKYESQFRESGREQEEKAEKLRKAELKKDRKPPGKRQDGLSKEERQRRYDSKACLRCGEVGHFRRDCPKNDDAGKQGSIKIGMIRGTPYPQVRRLLSKIGNETSLSWGEEKETEAP